MEDTMMTLAEILKHEEERRKQGNWIPACGGDEKPFTTRTGRRLQYCYQPSTGNHAYLDLATDIILTDEEASAALSL
jgi:hypothetical protein